MKPMYCLDGSARLIIPISVGVTAISVRVCPIRSKSKIQVCRRSWPWMILNILFVGASGRDQVICSFEPVSTSFVVTRFVSMISFSQSYMERAENRSFKGRPETFQAVLTASVVNNARKGFLTSR